MKMQVTHLKHQFNQTWSTMNSTSILFSLNRILKFLYHIHTYIMYTHTHTHTHTCIDLSIIVGSIYVCTLTSLCMCSSWQIMRTFVC